MHINSIKNWLFNMHCIFFSINFIFSHCKRSVKVPWYKMFCCDQFGRVELTIGPPVRAVMGHWPPNYPVHHRTLSPGQRLTRGGYLPYRAAISFPEPRGRDLMSTWARENSWVRDERLLKPAIKVDRVLTTSNNVSEPICRSKMVLLIVWRFL